MALLHCIMFLDIKQMGCEPLYPSSKMVALKMKAFSTEALFHSQFDQFHAILVLPFACESFTNVTKQPTIAFIMTGGTVPAGPLFFGNLLI